MNHRIKLALAVGCCLWASQWVRAQSAPQAPDASKPPSKAQQAPSQKPPNSEANPFPEDTTTVPVVPTTLTPSGAPPAANDVDSGVTNLLADDKDPIRSPDDPSADSSSGSDSGFSSSLQGMDDVKSPPDVEKPGRRGKAQEATHQESAAEDVNVGGYYLERKNWKAALSRFEAALVLDPENPDVYWGLAEAQRQLGDFPNAKANYLKVMEFDPDSRHGKDAKKFLKQPELANAPAVSANRPAVQTQQ
jgi:tetratricopeptide (TPR) repeat protein